ncbi:MAG TPA: hypothetical protein VNY36_03260 [Bacteroidia bacterium]|nr:hypothetical protein [Bacteroidia bacterium]
MSFSIAYSAWLLLLCPLAGAVYAWAFYYKDSRTAELHPALKWSLTAFRFLLVSFLVFLVLSPLIRSSKNTVEKPIVIIAQDNSASIVGGKDSAFYKHAYPTGWDKVINQLSAKYDVRIMSFGNEVADSMSYSFAEKETDISSVFDAIIKRYYGKNLGAVVVASDGIYNKGFNPLYAARSLKCNVYTVALGDTTVKRDAIVTKVDHNPTAFLGNTFPLQIILDAQKLEGKTSTLTVTELSDGKEDKLFVKPIAFSSSEFHLSVPVQLTAKSAGLKHYVVKLEPVAGEENLTNNIQDVYIHVLDQKQHILILSNPHPDVAAITESINNTDGFEADAYTPDKFTGELNKYCLVVLNQLPSTDNNITQILQNINKLNIPVFYILGEQTNLAAFNQLNSGLRITGFGSRSNDAEASPATNFSLFTLSDDFRNYAGQLPALSAPFGSGYQVSPSMNVLFYQKIQSVVTGYPLMAFNASGNSKICVIAGEGIFRWKLQDYMDHKSHKIFDELVTKTVQYLAVKDDKSFFRIHCPNSYKEDEPVEMDAELYNPSYQLINDPEVNIIITNTEGKKFSFTFNRTSNAYHLNAGQFQAGQYSYDATVKVGDQLYTKKGEFNLTPVQLELTRTIADHHLLYQLANEHSGKMLYPNQIEELPKLLDARDDIKPVIYSHIAYSPLIDLKWVFYVLLALACTEWFIRKWNGTY